MKSQLILFIEIDHDKLIGEARVAVSQWQETELVKNARTWEGVAMLPPFDAEKDVYPQAVTALRDVTDRAVGAMLDKIANHEELLMHDVQLNVIALRLGTWQAHLRPARMSPVEATAFASTGFRLWVSPHSGKKAQVRYEWTAHVHHNP